MLACPALVCPVNVSIGVPGEQLRAIVAAAGAALADIHSDAQHNRSVLTLAGPEVIEAARAVASATVSVLDISTHSGVHPRLGALDVVPFAPVGTGVAAGVQRAVDARTELARFVGSELGVPCFLYGFACGSGRSLPEIRRQAFDRIRPDAGPPEPHQSAGATAIGARDVLVAYNVWLEPTAPGLLASRIARALRGPAVRALGFEMGDAGQVSFNLLRPCQLGPAWAYDSVSRAAAAVGVRVARAELVGLAPACVLGQVPERRWAELDLSPARTIEARLAALGLA